MKAKLLTAAFSAAILSACSSEAAGPFDGKSAEEVVSYLLFGLEDKASVTMDTLTVSTEATQAKPLSLVVKMQEGSNSEDALRATVETSDNCTFTVAMKPLAINERVGLKDAKFSVDLTNVTAVEVGRGKNMKLPGAKIMCLEAAEDVWCKAVSEESTTGRWGLRVGPFEKENPETPVKSIQEKANQALSYFKANICKPKV
ncbi:hypothetical protein CO671_01815 [Rhizobium sp. M10]|uniref:hypothetical protein n=1 Tax=Rhizobium sp. M10 TaxID=1324586 RepID=UPI000BE7FD3D|nr:hypothetical protein [Rhizobium sp. M10]PDT38159.1 hypothetical protein CO671_01815 [Rhizobium sp. M10]